MKRNFFGMMLLSSLLSLPVYSQEDADVLIHIPNVKTINSTSLTVSCEFSQNFLSYWASQHDGQNYRIVAMGVIWSTQEGGLDIQNLNQAHYFNGYSGDHWDSHPGLENPAPNLKFIGNIPASGSTTFVIGDKGVCQVDLSTAPTNFTEELQPNTKYYIRTFVVFLGKKKWASLYYEHHSATYTFTTPNTPLINNNILNPSTTSFVCPNTTVLGISENAVSGGSGFTYQWEQSSDNSQWTPISSATTDKYTPSWPGGIAIPTKIWYRRKVTSGATSSYSTPVYFNFIPAPFNCTPVYDADDNPYIAVSIGSQFWLYENLRTTRFNDHTGISNLTTNATWTATTKPAFCQNTAAPEAINANLYNWYVANGSKNACPSGWHVSTTADWTTLEANSGGSTTAAVNLKSISYWTNSGVAGTAGDNSNSFFATPDGYYNSFNGTFDNLNTEGAWWTKNSSSASQNVIVEAMLNNTKVITSVNHTADPNVNTWKTIGCSVRCVKD